MYIDSPLLKAKAQVLLNYVGSGRRLDSDFYAHVRVTYGIGRADVNTIIDEMADLGRLTLEPHEVGVILRRVAQ